MMIDSAASFSADYPTARARFREAAGAAQAEIAAFAHPERGPHGGELATDIAWIGPRDAASVLVMQSATHGVEGFCGSGAQLDWLLRGEAARLPRGVAVLLVHAVNPYGFAWLRRVTHENVDLNRNWLDFDAPVPDNPNYRALQAAILPQRWDDAAQSATAAAFSAFVSANGFAALQQALSGGQYDDDLGIWYGGRAPTWSRRTLTDIYADRLGQARRIVILDYHTGLGPWGYAERMSMAPLGTPDYARAAAVFGAGVSSVSSGASTSAVIAGDGLSAAPGLLRHAEVTAIALEYGTLEPMLVLEAVRADAWLHARGELASDTGRAIKRQIRDAFYGDSDDWKGMVAGQSLTATRQALAYLAGG